MESALLSRRHFDGEGVLSFLPAPRKTLCFKWTTACLFWIVHAIFLGGALWAHVTDVQALQGNESAFQSFAVRAVLVLSVIHVAYVANFSCTDLAIQVRLSFLMCVVLAHFQIYARFLVYSCLMVIALQDAWMRYNIIERMLFLFPSNRPEIHEKISMDFILRLFSQEIPSASTPFYVRKKKPQQSAQGIEFGTFGVGADWGTDPESNAR
eukprot:TRINITY_DN58702_c0_g1_i1.p1 TRINITY_DN58702_c0_g1~~TRINITY_DN58702_c0_g1_i1.p1  ORF type:complete len:210 (+),score=23.76 TRINITY_DN58702_c0_g1_i1:95-724(+)